MSKARKGRVLSDENRAASNTGPKPTNVATFAKRKKMSMGGLV